MCTGTAILAGRGSNFLLIGPVSGWPRVGWCSWRGAAHYISWYEARHPDRGVLHQIVVEHFETFHALDGFDLHAGLMVPAGQRERLERVCRYVLSPPVVQERLHRSADGQVVRQLRHRGRDGTTKLVFDPVTCSNVCRCWCRRPRANLLFYHGVLAPRAAWCAEVVPRRDSSDSDEPETLKQRYACAP